MHCCFLFVPSSAQIHHKVNGPGLTLVYVSVQVCSESAPVDVCWSWTLPETWPARRLCKLPRPVQGFKKRIVNKQHIKLNSSDRSWELCTTHILSIFKVWLKWFNSVTFLSEFFKTGAAATRGASKSCREQNKQTKKPLT